MGFGKFEMSQIRAWQSSPAEDRWLEECGAHTTLLMAFWWPTSSATGSDGTLLKVTLLSFTAIEMFWEQWIFNNIPDV